MKIEPTFTPVSIIASSDPMYMQWVILAVGLIALFLATLSLFLVIRKQKDAVKLKEGKARLRAVFNHAADGITLIDGNGCIEDFNPACEALFGYSAAEVKGQNVKILMPEPYRHEHDGYLEHYQTTGERKIIGIGREVMGKRKDGTVFDIDLRVSEVILPGRKLYMGMFRDITDRKAHEEALRISEEGLKLGWQGTGVGMWDWNIVTNDLSFSDRFKQLLGYSLDGISDHFREWESRVHRDDLAHTLERLHSHLDHKTPYDVEYRLLTKSGEWRWFRAQGQARWDENGKPLRMAGSIDDITERKHSESVRQQLIDKLAESNTELERFAYVASHDLREPLRIVANFSTLLSKEYGENLEDSALEYLSHIKEASSRMHGMVGDLLEYARIGNEEMSFVTVDMNEEMRHVLENLAAFKHEHNASVSFYELPNVSGNPVQLMRLLQNLVGNAIKFHNKDVIPQVQVGVEEYSNKWRFFVRDNGIGMAKEYTQQIFEPFRQLHARNEYMGTGIGLAICKRIVEKHKGRLWVETEQGKGSTFYFELPKARSF